jgi:hypothetical protein
MAITVDTAGNLVKSEAVSVLSPNPAASKIMGTMNDLSNIVPAVLRGTQFTVEQLAPAPMSVGVPELTSPAGGVVGAGTSLAGFMPMMSGLLAMGVSIVSNMITSLLGVGTKAEEAEKRYLGKRAELIVELGRARAWASQGLVAPERPRHEGEILGATFEQFEKLEPYLTKDLQTEWYKLQLPGVIEHATTGEGPILSSQGPDDLINYAKSFEQTRRTYSEPQGI